MSRETEKYFIHEIYRNSFESFHNYKNKNLKESKYVFSNNYSYLDLNFD